MNKKLFIAFNLLLFTFVEQIEAGSLNCGNKDAATCKREFTSKLNFRLEDFCLNEMKTEIADTVKVFNAVIAELPANDPNIKLFKTSIDELQTDANKLEENRGNYEQTRAIINHLEMHMQPHVMLVSMDKKPLVKLEKLLDKHNYTKIIEKFDFNEFIKALTTMWTELYAELRSNDLTEYPAYGEINEKIKIIIKEKDTKTKEKLLREAMIKVREFCKIPFLEEVVFYGRNSVKQ